eukprot:scaffold1912_cov332-Prasinococcus_capsulatus_cf.AAC.4
MPSGVRWNAEGCGLAAVLFTQSIFGGVVDALFHACMACYRTCALLWHGGVGLAAVRLRNGRSWCLLAMG